MSVNEIIGMAVESREIMFPLFEDHIRELSSADLGNAIIAVDFDGTCVTHEFPEIGREVPKAVETLKALAQGGAKLILWTMRSDQTEVCGDPHSVGADAYLQRAVEWFATREIELWGINANPDQGKWTSSPKCYAQIYIDDAALGCPLRRFVDGGRSFVDWDQVAGMLVQRLLRNT